MAIFVSGDTHFGHSNIIKHCNRPFSSDVEMDKIMIRNWNEVVGPDDDVWHLGDFLYRARHPLAWYLEQLNGHIHLILGNHDKPYQRGIRAWDDFYDIEHYKQLNYDGMEIILFHYPIQSWYHWYRGAIHLHGHSHGKVQPIHRRMDVGVDSNDFRPIPLDSIVRIMRNIEVKGFDG